MKKLIIFISVLLLSVFLLISCGKNSDRESSHTDISEVQSAGNEASKAESSSALSDDNSSFTPSEDTSTKETPEFTYLDCTHKVKAENERDAIKYEYTFYLDDDKVEGATLVTTLKTEEEAKIYWKSVSKKYDNVFIKGCRVTIYFEDDEHAYIGFSEKQLLSALSKKIYKVTVIGKPVSEETNESGG